MENHIIPVDDIIGDKEKLEKRVTDFIGAQAALDPCRIIGKNFEMVDRSVRAILVYKNSAEGAVRVFGDEIRNVVTGPNEAGFVIVAVKSNEGETCRLLGTPTIQYFRRVESEV